MDVVKRVFQLQVAVACLLLSLGTAYAETEQKYLTFESVNEVVENVNRNYYHPLDRSAMLKAFHESLCYELDLMGVPFRDTFALSGNYEADLSLITDRIAEKKLTKDTVSRLIGTSLRQMLAALGDDGTKMETRGDFYKSIKLEGYNTGGVGFVMDSERDEDRSIRIIEVISGLEADRKGLKTGDRIVRINGRPTRYIPLSTASQMVRGTIGSTVDLTVIPRGQELARTVSLERIWLAPNVKALSGRMMGDGVLYVKVDYIGVNISSDIRDMIAAYAPEKILLDLRYCGGSLEGSVEMAGMFVPEKEEICERTERIDGVTRTYPFYSPSGAKVNLPVVVLTNEKTRSSGLLFASALQYYKKAAVVGVSPVWTESSELVFVLPNDWIYTVNNQCYRLPDEQIVTFGTRLRPDSEILQDPYAIIEKDLQLEAALGAFRRKSR